MRVGSSGTIQTYLHLARRGIEACSKHFPIPFLTFLKLQSNWCIFCSEVAFMAITFLNIFIAPSLADQDIQNAQLL